VYKIALIVPAVGCQETLDETLVSILENRPGDCQVLVPHAANYQDPYDLREEVRFVEHSSSDVASLLNAALEVSEADIVQIICPGVTVCEGWTDAALARFDANPDLTSVSPAVWRADRPDRLLAVGLRSARSGRRAAVGRNRTADAAMRLQGAGRLTVDGPLLHAGFYRRQLFAEIGGFNSQFGPLCLDLDLAARMREAKMTCEVELQSPHLLAGLPVLHGFKPARQMERLFWEYAPRRGLVGSLLLHGPSVVVETLRQLPSPSTLTSLLGRTAGLLQGMFTNSQAPELKLADGSAETSADAPTTLRIEDAPSRRVSAPAAATAADPRSRSRAAG